MLLDNDLKTHHIYHCNLVTMTYLRMNKLYRMTSLCLYV